MSPESCNVCDFALIDVNFCGWLTVTCILFSSLKVELKMFNSVDAFAAPPFWHNGPSPGNIYNFPNAKSYTGDYKQHSQ